MSWFAKSLISMLCFVPFFIFVGFANKNYGMKGEVAFALYLFGVCIGLFFWSIKTKALSSMTLNNNAVLICLITLLLGLIIGTVANVLLSQSIVEAPNPGLPPVIINVSGLLVFVISYALCTNLPKYFNIVEFTPLKLTGLILTIIGVGLIGLK